jgi:hypothetical protein
MESSSATEFLYQVNNLITQLLKPGVTEIKLNPHKKTAVKIFTDYGEEDKMRLFTTILFATATEAKRLTVTMALLDDLAALKLEGQGHQKSHNNVLYEFEIYEGESPPPSSKGSSSPESSG